MNPEKVSRQRAFCIATLVVSLLGLVVDRLFLGAGGPREAGAVEDADATAPGTSAASRTAAIALNAAPSLATRADTLAGRLDRLAREQGYDLVQVDDGFHPPLGWRWPAKAPARTAADQLTDAQKFARTHRLMAVVNNAAGGAAIIGNQTVAVGRVFDGFTLVAVTTRSAVLEKDGESVELMLPKPGAEAGK